MEPTTPIRVKTVYDQKALTAMARGLRRTVRKKHNRISRVIAGIIIALGLVTGVAPALLEPKESPQWLCLFVSLLLLVILCTEDWVNGFLARKKALPGTTETEAVFEADGYSTITQIGTTAWKYEAIRAVAESERYLVFVFGNRHAQIHDKTGITQGTPEELAALIREKTGLPIVKL